MYLLSGSGLIAEFEGVTPDQAIGRLVAHDVIDNIGSAGAAALDERFDF